MRRDLNGCIYSSPVPTSLPLSAMSPGHPAMTDHTLHVPLHTEAQCSKTAVQHIKDVVFS